MFAKFSVKKPFTVLVGVILVLVLGIVSITKMSADLLPDINLPYVVVMTTYVGASPETVETVVTAPVESAMATISNIEGINSMSSENYSVVILEFSQKANMDSVSLDIRESLDQLGSYWPDEVGSPILMKINPNMLPIMIAAVGMEGMDAAETGDFVNDKIVPELESVEGVASVSTNGIIEESIHVVIREDKVSEVNKKVIKGIDEKFEDAYKEIEDGKKTIEENAEELEKAEAEIAKGEKEIKNGQKKIDDGRKELQDKQDSTATELANGKLQLLTAKADLEAAKTNINTDIATLNALISAKAELQTQYDELKAQRDGLEAQKNELTVQRDGLLPQRATLENLLAQMQSMEEALANAGTGISGTIQAYGAGMMDETTANATLGTIKDGLTSIPTIGTYFAMLDFSVANAAMLPASYQAIVDGYLGSEEYISGKAQATEGLAQINAGLEQIEGGIAQIEAALPQMDEGLAQMEAGFAQIDDNISNLTMGQTTEAYMATQSAILAQLDESGALLDDGIIKTYEGELAASVGFANGLSQLDLAELQINNSKTQVESGKQQLETGKEQLDNAREQMEDGIKQLDDAKEAALESADMINVLTVDTIKGLLAAQNFSMPAGYVDEGEDSYLIRVGDKPDSLESLQNLVLMKVPLSDGEVITLSDVADVFVSTNEDSVYTNVNGQPGVVLTMQKQTGYSTGNVSDSIKDKLQQLRDEYEGSAIVELMDQGIYIDLVMSTILENVLVGGLLAVLILILFLRDIRPTLIIAISIPVSLMTAIVCMYFSGVTLNVISLSGLALGVGMLVDNSIVVIENIYRLRNEGMPIKEAAVTGAKEVAGAIFASTLTTVCVFLPIVFTEGLTRQIFVDMGLTIAYSLMASLLVALTVVPACAAGMLKKIKPTKSREESKFYSVYAKFLGWCLRFKPIVIIVVIALLVASAFGAYTNGTAYFPDMESTQITINMTIPDDSEVTDIKEQTDTLVEKIATLEDVVDIGAMSASTTLSLFGAQSSDEVVTSSTIYVTTKEKSEMSSKEIAKAIEDMGAKIPGVSVFATTSTMDMSMLGGSGVSIEIAGRDLDTLYSLAEQAEQILRETEGVGKVESDITDAGKELRISVDKSKAALYGLTVAQVYSQIYPKIADVTSATTLSTATNDISVYVEDEKNAELTRQDIMDMELTYTNDDQESDKVKLNKIADFEDGYGMKTINRKSQSRYVSISASIADGYNVNFVSQDIEKNMKKLDVPKGYELSYGGENEMIIDALKQLSLMLVLAIVFIYLIMVAQFQSLGSPFIIMFTIPLAFTGGFAALFFSGYEISIVAMVGLVMLSGIIVNNGIVLVDYINQRRKEGLTKKEAIIDAGITRLRPVLMTALTTILALVMMAFSHKLGADMTRPLAIVVIGGMVYGTLMTLIVVPCIYDLFVREKKADDDE